MAGTRLGVMTDAVLVAAAAAAVVVDAAAGVAVEEAFAASLAFLGTAISTGGLLDEEDAGFGRLRELSGGGVSVTCVSDKLCFHSTRRCSHCELMRQRISPRVIQLTSIACDGW